MGIAYFTCSICGSTYSSQEVQYTCPRDGANLDVHCDFETAESKPSMESILLSSEQSIWRFAPLLPVPDPVYARTPLHQLA
jgi:threonine synthase